MAAVKNWVTKVLHNFCPKMNWVIVVATLCVVKLNCVQIDVLCHLQAAAPTQHGLCARLFCLKAPLWLGYCPCLSYLSSLLTVSTKLNFVSIFDRLNIISNYLQDNWCLYERQKMLGFPRGNTSLIDDYLTFCPHGLW